MACSSQRSCGDGEAASAAEANIPWAEKLLGRGATAAMGRRSIAGLRKQWLNYFKTHLKSIYPPWPHFLLLHLMLDWPVESICSWEPRRSNHWRWKIITTVWTSWQRPREKTMIKDGSRSSMSTNWADSADIYLCVTLTAALQVCPTFSSLSEGSAQQANHLTHKYNNNSNNNNKMNY